MTNGPSATLHAEHAAFGSLLDVLAGMSREVGEGKPLPRDDFRDALTVLVEFGDRCHQVKEEDILFPRLIRASPGVGAELARRLAGDHGVLRGLVSEISVEFHHGSATKASRIHFGRLLATYVRVLREHIRMEEELLLPEVERALSPEDRAWVQGDFERLEREDLGWGMQEAYVSIIRRLGETYTDPAASTPSAVQLRA
jgi:hemerythrin-like domain-containing protein